MSARTDKDTSLTEAAVGALADVQGLLKHAAKAITFDSAGLSRTVGEAASLLAAAWAMMVIGGVLVCMALVYGPASVLPSVPVWAWFAVVGVPTIGVGATLCLGARAKFTSLQPTSEVTTASTEDAVKMAEHLGENIESAKASIHRSFESMKATVESIEHAVDLNYQVQQRPWAMLAGAAGLGFVGGAIINSASDRTAHRNPGNGHTATGMPGPQWPSTQDEPGLFGKLGDLIAPQAQLARDIAIGALFGLARDWAREGVSKPLSQPVNDFFDQAAAKFNGRTASQAAKTPAAEAQAVATQGTSTFAAVNGAPAVARPTA